jgi:lysine 2,3-aminomutase
MPWQQYVPTTQSSTSSTACIDSLDEDGRLARPQHHAPLPGPRPVPRQPICATYSLTRRRKVGDPEKIPLNQYDSAFEYIRSHPEIRDVIMSGGDPMMLSDRRLEYIFQRLREIPHVEIIRLGSRITSHLPSRITPEFCEMVKKYHPIYMNTHFNHPAELTPESIAALARLADAGVPLGCQTVLLRGVNDDPAIMKDLMQKLLKARVRPYYIYMADRVAGGEHFHERREGLGDREALAVGRAVRRSALRDRRAGRRREGSAASGYVEEINEDEVIFRTTSQRFVYKQPRPMVTVRPAAIGGCRIGNSADQDPEQAAEAVARKRKTGT